MIGVFNYGYYDNNVYIEDMTGAINYNLYTKSHYRTVSVTKNNYLGSYSWIAIGF